MAPPKKLPKFPTLAERRSLMAQLLEAERNGTAPTNNEHYRNYAESLKALNEKMDGYSAISEEDGLPPTLDNAGKEELLNAMRETALLGETFLADVANKKGNLNTGIPGIVGRVQGMLSKDFSLLRDYDPTKTPLSFPELQQNARTQVVDFRGKKIGVMTNRLSGRIPMTVVAADGTRRMGVFTKATYVRTKKSFQEMIEKAAAFYDSPAFRNNVTIYKRALIRDGKFPNTAEQDVTDEMVAEKMKQPLQNLLPNYRTFLKANPKKNLYGADLDTAPDEHIIGLMYNHLMDEKTVRSILNAAQIDANTLPTEVLEELEFGMEHALKEELADTVNGRDLGLRDGDRVDHRNTALTAAADLLGLSDICARSNNMKYLDEDGNEVEGTFMEFADGLDLCGKKGENLFVHVNEDPFKIPCEMNSQLADLQILDYLSGNVDRHGGNMMYKVDETGKITGIMGIDNDTSFGKMPVDRKNGAFRLAGVDKLRVITTPMAAKIKNMTPDMLKFALRGRGLSEEEMKGACDRLTELKNAVQRNSVEINSTAGLKSAKSGKLCIVKPEDLNKIPFRALADENHTVFEKVRADLVTQMGEARAKGYNYNATAKRPEKPKFTEISTTDRIHSAGGIGESMGDMSRALKNEVTGFEVGGLSRFLHSSGKWRSMISAVKAADKAAKAINKAIGKDKEYLTRDDPKVRQQVEKANRAMENVRKANDEYLQRKMREKNVNSPEELVGRGKHAYEQKRIDYALKLRKSIQAYDELQNPQNEKQKQQKAAVQESLEFAAKRRSQQAAQPQR